MFLLQNLCTFTISTNFEKNIYQGITYILELRPSVRFEDFHAVYYQKKNSHWLLEIIIDRHYFSFAPVKIMHHERDLFLFLVFIYFLSIIGGSSLYPTPEGRKHWSTKEIYDGRCDRRCSAKNPWCSGQGEFVFHILYWDFLKQIYLNYFLFFRTKRYIRLEDSDWRIWLKLFYNSEIELVEQVLWWSSKRL